MMNRKLAHGRHLEWGLRVNEQCNPQVAFEGESGQCKQRSESMEPNGHWLPASNDSLVSVVRHTIDGIWPDTMATMA